MFSSLRVHGVEARNEEKVFGLKRRNPLLGLIHLPWLVTYLGLVEHHLFGRELGHDVAAAAGESAGAQRTKACDRSSAPAYYMHDSGHAFLSDSHNKDAAKCA